MAPLKSKKKSAKKGDLGKLMALAQQGDSAAYAKLLTDVLPIVRKIVNEKWQGNKNMREDIVQDVLLNLHMARHTYDPARPFRPWLYAITRYRVVEAVRTAVRKTSKEIGTDKEIYETFADDRANSKIIDVENKDLLEKAMDKLPLKQQQAVRLVKLQGLSMAEAALKADTSVTAMKVNAHRAYKALRKIIEKELAA